MKNSIFLVIVILLSGIANAQYSVGGGFSTLFQFGNSRPFVGLNLITEFPRNNDQTFYVRANVIFKQTINRTVQEVIEEQGSVYAPLYAYGIDPMTTPSAIIVGERFSESFNFITVDAGTRYYIINGYDEGFSLYGGTTIGGVVNSVKWAYKTDDFDQTNYSIDNLDRFNTSGKGTILNLSAGLTGGAKYTMPGRGTFFIDLSPSYMILGLPSSQNIQTTMYKKVIFNFNIGFRKEFY